jgi:hypothetical protein
VGLEVHRSNVQGVLVSSGRFMCSMPVDHFRYGRLGEDHVGVTVLDVFIGDTKTIMSHEQGCHVDSFVRTDGRTMAVGASVT